MPEPLKNGLNEAAISRLADNLHRVWPALDRDGLIRGSMKGLDALELKGRIAHVSDQLAAFLPDDWTETLAVVVSSAATWDSGDPEDPYRGFAAWPLFDLIERHGVDDFEGSMGALREITHLFSAEFAVRPFLARYPEPAFAKLTEWARDDREHVRRLASEGCRPRLPWATRIPALIDNPTPVIAILELLKDDPELYVRRSVANNLNDIAKDHPDRVIDTCERWLEGASKERKWIVGHATRTLVKAGHPRIWGLLGFEKEPKLEVSEITLDSDGYAIGDRLTLEVGLTSTATSEQRLAVDYAIHFVKANGKTRPKVFKLKVLTLSAGEVVTLTSRQSLKQMSTRTHHPGRHQIDILVNGEVRSQVWFDLEA